MLAVVVASTAMTVGLVIDPPLATAAGHHRTLNDTRSIGSAPVTPGHAIDYFGLVADLDSPNGALTGQGASPYGEARFLVDARWTAWQSLDQDGAQAEGQFTGSLIAVDHATAYQVRNLPKGAHNWRAAAINTTDGPVEAVPMQGSSEAHAAVVCRSRADWGADESTTGWARGDVRAFSPAQVMTVHHTATSNSSTQDYSATMRAILNYHVTSNGWSDIGYQYLIDRNGIVYEGRSAGSSVSCLNGGGDGSDFAHQAGTDDIVTGAHVATYNSGNIGVALMGCFNTAGGCTGDMTVPAASLGGLESLLAGFADRHSLSPQGSVRYVNPVTGLTATMPTIATHQDWPSAATACPGDNLYPQLPTIRENVARLAAPQATTVPAAPSNLAATATSKSRIKLTWVDNASNEDLYLIERCKGATCTNFAQIASVGPATSFTDGGLSARTTYRYRVRASNAAGASGYSNTSATTTPRK
ncbi:MAG TPA: N-acetylmuramoyl-L-alanine amidase [Arachnia sp.]|nr:N-acetylmuramoyl-L-alanine amidase [Arachnia sp.]